MRRSKWAAAAALVLLAACTEGSGGAPSPTASKVNIPYANSETGYTSFNVPFTEPFPDGSAVPATSWSDRVATGSGKLTFQQANVVIFTIAIGATKTGASPVSASPITHTIRDYPNANVHISGSDDVPSNKRPTLTVPDVCGWTATTSLVQHIYAYWQVVTNVSGNDTTFVKYTKHIERGGNSPKDQITCQEAGCDDPYTIEVEECEGGSNPINPPSWEYTSESASSDEASTEIYFGQVLRCWWEDHFWGSIYLGRIYTHCEVIDA